MSAVSDIADILASEFHDFDVVPSDIAVGLILLREEEERQKAEKTAKGEVGKDCAVVQACGSLGRWNIFCVCQCFQ